MKKAFAILAIAGVMVACNSKKEDKPAENKDTVAAPAPAPVADTTKPVVDTTAKPAADTTKK